MVDADLKVLDTMAGGGMDTAGAALQRDMVAQNDQTLAVKEGMLVLHEFQLAAKNSLGQTSYSSIWQPFIVDSTRPAAMIW